MLRTAVLYCITRKSLGMTTGLTLSAQCMHFVCAVQNVETGSGHSAASFADRATQWLAISTNARVAPMSNNSGGTETVPAYHPVFYDCAASFAHCYHRDTIMALARNGRTHDNVSSVAVHPSPVHRCGVSGRVRDLPRQQRLSSPPPPTPPPPYG